MVSVPTEMGDAMQYLCARDEDTLDACNAVGDLVLHAGGESAQHSRLDGGWAELNAPIMCAECGEEEDTKPEARWCRNAGMCLCVGEGRNIAKCRDAFHDLVLKPFAPAHSEQRAMLKDGRYAVSCAGRAPASLGEDPANRDVDEEVILHISFMNLPPWRATWMLLERAEPPAGEPPTTERRAYFKVTTSIDTMT